MSKSDPTPEEIKKLANMDTKTRTEAKHYVTDKMDIGKDMYYEFIYPEIKGEFRPVFIGPKGKKASNIRIPTKRLDEIIAYFNKKLEDHIQTVKEEKEY